MRARRAVANREAALLRGWLWLARMRMAGPWTSLWDGIRVSSLMEMGGGGGGWQWVGRRLEEQGEDGDETTMCRAVKSGGARVVVVGGGDVTSSWSAKLSSTSAVGRRGR